MAVESKFVLSARDNTGTALKSAKRNMTALDRAAKGLAVGMAAAFVAKRIVGGIAETANQLDALAKRSRQLGLSSSELDAWSHAATLSGAGAAGLDAGLRRLPGAIYDASRGLKEQKDAFAELGVKVTDADGKMKSVTDVMLDMADGMQRMEDPTRRAGVAQKLLGKSAQALIPMLTQGRDALTGQLVEAYALGVRYDDMTVKGELFADAQARLDRSMRGVKDTIISATLPSLSILAEMMGDKVVTAITGLDREFRLFLGTLRVMPGETAFDAIMEKEAALRTEMAVLEKEYGAVKAGMERGSSAGPIFDRAGVDALTKNMMGLGGASVEAFNRVAEIRRELQALEKTEADLSAQQKLLADEQLRWKDLSAAAADALEEERAATEAANTATAERVRIMGLAQRWYDRTRTEQEKLTADMAEAHMLYRMGKIDLETYIRAYGLLSAELNKTGEEFDDLGGAGKKAAEEIEDSFDNTAESMKRGLASAIVDMKGDLSSLASFAERVFSQIAEQRIYDLISGAFSGGVAGISNSGGGKGGKNQLAAVPGDFTPAGGGDTYNITIQAMDSESSLQFLARPEHQRVYAGVIQQQFNKAGLKGMRR